MMKFDKIQKLTFFIVAICCMALVGYHLKDSMTTYEVITKDESFTERIKVTLSGEVAHPGTYTVMHGTKVYDAIYGAGGVTENAELSDVELEAIVMDNTEVYIPSIGEKSVQDAIPLININEADAKTLELIPGIGEALSARIIEYRKENGPFKTMDDLCNVDGIGKVKAEKIMEYIVMEELPK